MSHACFISFKKEDRYYRDKIVERLGEENILGKSLEWEIKSEDLDYVMQRIRDDCMKGTSVTLYLIGKHSSENEGLDEYGRNIQSFMIRELQATLFDRKNNRLSGLIGIVLPEMEKEVFLEKSVCEHCGSTVESVCVGDSTVLREFWENYWLVKNECGHYCEDGRFCILVRYSEFMNKGKAEEYIEAAFQKTKADIAKQVHYRDIKHKGLKNYK